MTHAERQAIEGARDALDAIVRANGAVLEDETEEARRASAALDALLAATEVPSVRGEWKASEHSPVCASRTLSEMGHVQACNCAPCPGCAERDAILARLHAVIGEAPESDDATLPDVIERYLSERDARINELDVRTREAEERLAGMTRQRDEARDATPLEICRTLKARAERAEAECARLAAERDQAKKELAKSVGKEKGE